MRFIDRRLFRGAIQSRDARWKVKGEERNETMIGLALFLLAAVAFVSHFVAPRLSRRAKTDVQRLRTITEKTYARPSFFTRMIVERLRRR